MVVVFEGIDTAGKSSVIAGIVKSNPKLYVPVRDVGVDELVQHSKTFARFGIDSKSPDSLQLLYCAIILGTEVELEKILEKGQIPLVDRYLDTLVVYANLFTEYRRPIQMHRQIAELIDQFARPTPDVTFFLDVDYADVITRLRQRKELGMLERFSPDVYRSIKQGFFERMGRSDRRYVIVPKGLTLSDTVKFCLDTIRKL